MGEELVRSVDCIDYAVAGEGDRALPELLAALVQGCDPVRAPGVLCRRDGAVPVPSPSLPLQRLDDLPVPDYSEFFDRALARGLIHRKRAADVYIPFEASRGCWWGHKHHCTFCGLNGSAMHFRSKSIQRVLNELADLAGRHHSFHFEAVDNILDLSYLALFSQVAKTGIDYKFFYEVKANLTREQLKILSTGGVHRIQPGIESLSTRVLRLMRKGVTAIQNVNLLRWALYYRVHVSWNLIWGFPRETSKDYEGQLKLLRQIVHLPPPTSAGRVWMERFSPLYFDRENFPAVFLRPERSYSYVYPKHIQLDYVAYFFDYELADTLPDSAFTETRRHIKGWRAMWKNGVRPRLVFWHAPGLLRIDDARDPAAPRELCFADPAASIYASCSDRPRSAANLKETLDLSLSVDDIEGILNEFIAYEVMIQDGSLFLSLALPATHNR
jgi:ribosomal peptide maturation radical SAM protein 1